MKIYYNIKAVNKSLDTYARFLSDHKRVQIPLLGLSPLSLPRLSTMRFSSFVSAASAVAFASLVVADADADKASDVLDVTQDTFESVVHPESLILVEFFAPW